MAVARALEFSETDAAIKACKAEADAEAKRQAPPASPVKRMLTEFIGGLGGG